MIYKVDTAASEKVLHLQSSDLSQHCWSRSTKLGLLRTKMVAM